MEYNEKNIYIKVNLSSSGEIANHVLCYLEDNNEYMRFVFSLDFDTRCIMIESCEYNSCIPSYFLPSFLVFCSSEVNELLYLCRWTRVVFRKEQKDLVTMYPRKNIQDDLPHGEWIIIDESSELYCQRGKTHKWIQSCGALRGETFSL